MPGLHFESSIDFSTLDRNLQVINTKLDQFTKNTVKSGDQMESMAKRVGQALGAYLSFQGASRLSQQLISVRGEFQKYQAVLTNTLQSEEDAAAAMDMLVEKAASTPSQLSELTGAYVKLVNQGFKPTSDELTKLSDIASSTGKGFDQLAEAIIDAQTGEFERLKEFGIRASKEGENVTFTFRGVQEQVEFTADSIQQYILSLGNLEGVSGASAAIMGTLVGKVSNLKDAIDQMLNSIGQDNEGLLGGSIDAIALLVNNYETIIDIVKVLAVSYGTYKTAVVLSTVATNGLTIAENLHYAALILAEKAQKLLNITMLANPYILVASLVAGLVTSLIVFSDTASEAERVQKRLSDVTKRAGDEASKEEAKIRVLLATINNENASRAEKERAIKELNSISPEYLGNLDAEILATKNGKDAIDAYIESVKKRIEVQELEKELTDSINRERVAASGGLERGFWAGVWDGMLTQLGLFSVVVENYAKDIEEAISAEKTLQQEITKRIQQLTATKKDAGNDSQKKSTIKDLESDLSKLEKQYKEETDRNDKAELERIKRLIIAKKQEIEKFKIEIEKPDKKTDIELFESDLKKKKELYEQFEAYKKVVGEEEAKEMYADLTSQGETYISYLRSLLVSLPVGEKKAIVATELVASDKAERNSNQEALDKLLEETQTYNEKRLLLNYQYEQKRIALTKAGATDNIKVLDQQHKDELAALEESHIKKSESYRWVFDDMQRMNRQALRDYIDRLKKEVENSKLTAEVKLQLAEKLAAAERELINKAPIAAISRANARIKELNALKAKVLDPKDRENIDKQILEQQQNKGDALVATFSNVSARLSEAEGIAANFSEELAGAVSAAAGVANAFAQIASGNYIGGFIQLAKSVLDIQARIEQTKQAKKDADDMARRRDSNKLIEEANTLLEQQLALLDKIRGVDLYSGIINSKDALISALEEYNKAIEKLDLKDANTKYEVWGSSWFSNGFAGFEIYEYRKKIKFKQFDFSALQGLMSDAVENPDYSKIKAVYDEIERIRSLIADGTIFGDTEDLEKQLKDYEDLLEKAEAFAAKQAQLLTGSTYDSVVDGLAAAFDDGIYSAQEFADSFEKIMQKAIINSIKINALKGPLDDWYKQFTTLSEDGLSEEDINILKEGYMAIADGAALAFENMKEITGIDFGSSSFASLQGAIKGMSEETAGLLAGQFNALRINSAEHLNVAREALLYQAKTAANTAELSRQLNDIKGLIKPSSNDPLRGKGL